MNNAFEGSEAIISSFIEAAPYATRRYFQDSDGEDGENDETVRGDRVQWFRGSGEYILEIASDRVMFTEQNSWFPDHGAGLMQAMRTGSAFEMPPARVYRIKASDVKTTQAYEKKGELLYQLNMVRPWTKADVGKYTAQLLDGNHRAAAAMALGEKSIFVHVVPNSRSEVLKKDWL